MSNSMKLKDIDLLKVGHTIQMAGAVYAGEGKLYLTMFPDESGQLSGNVSFRTGARGTELDVTTLDMTLDDWTRFLQQTDLLETEVLTRSSDGTLAKAIVRKSQRQISQGVSWSVYRRDGFQCRYCAADDVPLTVDHLVLWEEGGPSTQENLVTCCRKDNKVRGNLSYVSWLRHPRYLAASRNLSPEVRAANEALVETLAGIPRSLHQRSR